MSLCSRSSSRQILTAPCHPRCGQITTHQQAFHAKGSSPCWRAGLLMLGPRRDSRHSRRFIRLPRVGVINIIRVPESRWMSFCRKDGQRTIFTAVPLGPLGGLALTATNLSYRSRLTREGKQLRPHKTDKGQPLGRSGTLHKSRLLTRRKEPPPDKGSMITAQNRVHGMIAPQQYHDPRHSDQQSLSVSLVRQMIGTDQPLPARDSKTVAQSRTHGSIVAQ
jgi:hypothetical protein